MLPHRISFLPCFMPDCPCAPPTDARQGFVLWRCSCSCARMIRLILLWTAGLTADCSADRDGPVRDEGDGDYRACPFQSVPSRYPQSRRIRALPRGDSREIGNASRARKFPGRFVRPLYRWPELAPRGVPACRSEARLKGSRTRCRSVVGVGRGHFAHASGRARQLRRAHSPGWICPLLKNRVGQWFRPQPATNGVR